MYDDVKKFEGRLYTGMKVGGSHKWKYNNGEWNETKVTPNQWKFKFNSLKTRNHDAPANSGASKNTKFHWYIIADQIATKLDQNKYMTNMHGVKFKIGHKRPNWSAFTYEFPKQESYNQKVIKILENILYQLKNQESGIKKYL